VGWVSGSIADMQVCFRATFALISGFLLFFAAITSSAKADVIYTYTGNDFNSFSGSPPLNSSDFISSSFTFASALPDNLNDVENPGSLLNWSMSDQVDTLSDTGGNTLLIFVSTNASGTITGWGMGADNPGTCAPTCYSLVTEFNLPQLVGISGTFHFWKLPTAVQTP
jgi:hypothetical protein